MTTPADFPQRIDFAQAIAIVDAVAATRRLPAETVATARAHGRVCAEDVVANIPQPPFDNAAMDGFAFRRADLDADGGGRLRLDGERFAGSGDDRALVPGDCRRITTGAPLPPGADTVVMKENTRLDGDHVVIADVGGEGQHVRRAGEDIAPGDRVLAAGDTLTPARIALAASQGLATLQVAPRPTVAVFTTGDELVEAGLPLAHGQIHNSNRDLLVGLLRNEGLDPVAWPTLPDDPAAVESALRHAGEAFDVVITCGGVSAGEKDHVPEVLQRLGTMHFWRVLMRPGMPLLLASGGGRHALGDALFLGLPGNPVSVLATTLTVGRRLFDALQGRAPRPTWRARLAAPWRKRHARREFLRGRLRADDDGVLWVEASPADGSHRMEAAASGDSLVVLPEGVGDHPAGMVVEVVPY